MKNRIIGTGSCLPKQALSNVELEKNLDTSDEWIRKRVGIQSRYVCTNGEDPYTLALGAAQQAIKNAELDANELDLIIVATTTPKKIFPSLACMVQAGLGISNVPAFDLQAVCSGFVYALSVADDLMKAGRYNKVLVIGAEAYSKVINWQDRSTAILFGDGAAAVVLSSNQSTGIIDHIISSEPDTEDLLTLDNPYINGFNQDSCFVKMQGQKVYKYAVTSLTNNIKSILANNNLSISDVDFVVPHQANIRILEAVADKVGLEQDKIILTIEKHANTSAASIPLALDHAATNKLIKEGSLVLMVAFGAGFTNGAVLLNF
jgi:3-oxoacyl-[acyl-carrier-protein] synthase-3